MIQLLVTTLPVTRVFYQPADMANKDEEAGPLTTISALRHWLVYPDARIFFQDETIQSRDGVMQSSERSDWEQLPTPPLLAQVAGTFEYQGLPGAITTDGKAYVWAARNPEDDEEERALELLRISHRVHDWPHKWVQFHEPIPGTPAYAEYTR